MFPEIVKACLLSAAAENDFYKESLYMVAALPEKP